MIEKSNIVIASNRFLIASGIGSYFEALGHSVSFVNSTQDALERLLISKLPEFVIVDEFESVFKVEKTVAFLSFTKPAKMILLSDTLTKERYELLTKVGVRHFISSQLQEHELSQLYDCIINTELFHDKIIEERLKFNPQQAFKNTCAELNISEREVEIIKLIAEGFINKEIANKLFLSTHTVNTHRKNIMSKLGVSNATGIVIFAVKEKLVSPKDFLFSSKH